MASLKTIPLAVILAGVLFSGCFYYLSGLQSGYSGTIDLSGFNKTQTNMIKQQNDVNDTLGSLQRLQITTDVSGIVTAPYDMIRIAWGAIKQLLAAPFYLFDTVNELITELSKQGLGIPIWFIGAIISLITLGLVISLIELFFRWFIR